MKNLISTFIILAALCLNLSAQKTVETSHKLNDGDKVKLDFQFADEIKVNSWDKAEIYVKVSVDINDNKNNDAFRFEINDYPNGIRIEEEIKDLNKMGKHKRRYVDEDGEEITVVNCGVNMTLVYEVFLPEKVKLKIETISGDINITKFTSEMDIHSISGDVDLSLKQSAKADLDLSTISGEMYSDFDFKSKNDGYHHYGRSNFKNELNGGGTPIELSTISGNIYLRKK